METTALRNRLPFSSNFYLSALLDLLREEPYDLYMPVSSSNTTHREPHGKGRLFSLILTRTGNKDEAFMLEVSAKNKGKEPPFITRLPV